MNPTEIRQYIDWAVEAATYDWKALGRPAFQRIPMIRETLERFGVAQYVSRLTSLPGMTQLKLAI